SFTDYDSTMTITADHTGLVDNGDGTWTWSGTRSEEAGYTVKVTALNEDGLTATDTFDVTFNGVAPTVLSAAADANADENAPASTSGSFTDYDSTMTITADHTGLVDNGDGTWTWSGTAHDDAAY